ncbi:response regulator receiver domain protein (CheY-like) [Pelodictyon luteolum DSM 273]|nr:response regulator receiver domain protein (CheY-like) [Pelodictyon luteolum DSM 273]
MFERMPSALRQTNENTVQSSSWRLMKSDWVLRSPSNIPIQLTSKEYELIMFLIQQDTAVISRAEILKHLDYPYNEYGSLALKSLVYRLRKKMDDAGCTFPIKTIHGTGYALSSPISIA